MKDMTVKRLTLMAMFIALVFVATFSIRIPTPTGGYLNLGDGMIYTISVVFGWQAGMIAGAFGSAFTDIVAAAPQWAIFTFIIKGLMGLVAGKFANSEKPYSIKTFAGILIATVIMVGGYYIAATVLLGNHIAALEGIPGNILQSVIGIAVYIPLTHLLKKAVLK